MNEQGKEMSAKTVEQQSTHERPQELEINGNQNQNRINPGLQLCQKALKKAFKAQNMLESAMQMLAEQMSVIDRQQREPKKAAEAEGESSSMSDISESDSDVILVRAYDHSRVSCRKHDRGHSRDHSRGRSRGRSRGHSRGHSRGRSRGHSRGYSRGNSRGRSRGPSRGHSRGRSCGRHSRQRSRDNSHGSSHGRSGNACAGFWREKSSLKHHGKHGLPLHGFLHKTHHHCKHSSRPVPPHLRRHMAVPEADKAHKHVRGKHSRHLACFPPAHC